MARPIKKGLDYFPLDVDFFDDEKIEAIQGEFGINGEIVAVKLLCEIYRGNGYYAKWDELFKMRLLKRLPGLTPDFIEAVINRMVQWGFFNKSYFEASKILTSKGIQERFLLAAKRREENQISVYDCINPPENIVNVYNNHPEDGVSVDISTQSKVKEIKEKEIKENQKKQNGFGLSPDPPDDGLNFENSDFENPVTSQGEQKKQTGAGPRRRTPGGGGQAKEDVTLKNPFSQEFYAGIWDVWKQHRVDKKCPIKSVKSENTALKHLHKLAGGSEHVAVGMLEKAISNGWQGFDYAAPVNGSQNGARPQTENQRLRDLVNNNSNLIPDPDRYVEVPDPAGGFTMSGKLFLADDGMIKFIKAGRTRLTIDPNEGFKPSAIYLLAPGQTIEKIYESLLAEKQSRKSA